MIKKYYYMLEQSSIMSSEDKELFTEYTWSCMAMPTFEVEKMEGAKHQLTLYES